MQNVYPALRITDYEKSKAFYVDGLGFLIESEHRFAPHLPVFMTISHDGLSLYLSQHAGDCQPGGLVFLYVPVCLPKIPSNLQTLALTRTIH
jgi:catechol 2,3-dioxygenase-like lactoylglutathione lyase family enzyme